MTVVEIINKIKNKEIKPSEVFEIFLQNYEKWNTQVKAWADYDAELVLEKYKKADAKKIDWELTPLFGVPIGIKDCYNTYDFHTRRGSPIYKNYTAGNDARIIRKVVDEGAVSIGKTSTAEFSVHEPSSTLNPYNLEHTPGTSSGGSAVAIATGMAPLCFGTQTAASTSKPCSYCGVYGLKPTFGHFPRTGVLKTSDTLDTLTLIGKSVNDLSLVFNTIKLKGLDYPIIHKKDQQQKGVTKPKIGIVHSTSEIQMKGYVVNAVNEFAESLNGIADVEEVSSLEWIDEIRALHRLIYNKGVSYYFDYEYKNHKKELSESILEMIEGGHKVSKDEYLDALQKQDEMVQKIHNTVFSQFDFLLTAATNGTAPKGLHDHEEKDFSLAWTFLGVPLVVCPKFENNELPFGLQFAGPKYSDQKLLNFVKELKDKNILRDAKVI